MEEAVQDGTEAERLGNGGPLSDQRRRLLPYGNGAKGQRLGHPYSFLLQGLTGPHRAGGPRGRATLERLGSARTTLAVAQGGMSSMGHSGKARLWEELTG